MDPSLTVAVISIVGGEVLERCLAAIPEGADELLAVTRSARDEALPAALGWRAVDGRESSVPQRRARALRAARCDIVALIEDTCVPNARWPHAIRRIFADASVAAAGGPVAIDAALPPSSIALACAEYGRYHPRRFGASGPTSAIETGIDGFPGLPGANLALRRSSVERFEPGEDGLIEAEVAMTLRALGSRLVFDREMEVSYRFGDPGGARLVSRFRHGRLYAGRRARAEGAAARARGLIQAPLLPLVLSARAMRTLRLPELKRARTAALPWLVLQQTAWSAGELVGYLSGPGRALEAWR